MVGTIPVHSTQLTSPTNKISQVQPRRRSLHCRDAALFIATTPHSSSAQRALFIAATPHSSSARRRTLHRRNAALFIAATPHSSLARRRTLHRRDAALFIAATPLSSSPRRSKKSEIKIECLATRSLGRPLPRLHVLLFSSALPSRRV